MLVSLYTSRIVLKELGIEDYGIYNVVGGVVSLFAFLNGALATSTSRYLTYELGKENNLLEIKKVFSTAFNIHSFIALIVIIFAETFGLWILNNTLVISEGRITAANIIYQYVILSTILTITQVPFNASIIANEKMSIYAWISIVEVILKLLVAYLISIITFDKLIFFGSLNMIISISIYCFYIIYCKKRFIEFNFNFNIDKPLTNELLRYSFWNLLGSLSVVLKTSGINMVLNIFFGIIVNAANAIAYQVNTAVTNFSSNFTVALNPQIIKSYAQNDKKRLEKLLIFGGKLSFFLVMIISIPIIIETDLILHYWLGEYPIYTSVFVKLVLFLSLIESFNYTIGAAMQATGKIRNYQLVVSGFSILNLPIVFLLFILKCEPYWALLVSIIISTTTSVSRLFFLHHYIGVSARNYLLQVFLTSLIILITSSIIPFCIINILPISLERLVLVVFTSILCSSISFFFISLDNIQRNRVCKIIKSKITLIINHLSK
jgi:O-antigen/teichoic acid export membrane protein